MSGRLILRLVSGALMAPMFLLSVVVQWNDPDPIPWMVLYGAAFGLSVGAALWRHSWPIAAGTALAAGVWALTLAPDALAFLRSDHEPIAFYMKTGDSLEEAARECGGLLLVFLWCGALAIIARVSRKAEPA